MHPYQLNVMPLVLAAGDDVGGSVAYLITRPAAKRLVWPVPSVPERSPT